MSASAEQAGWLSRLKQGLGKSSTKLSDGIGGIFTKAKLDDEAIESLEELLIEADLGAQVAVELSADLAAQRFDKGISPEDVRIALASQITAILEPYAQPLELNPAHKPSVIMMVGVNGNGKTTTIGKLASQYRQQGKKVMLAAADTFRAAAVEQLQIWGERAQIPVVTGPFESDPASVAYKALEQAQADECDVLFIDTAGRLHNKTNLMAELEKISNVLKKLNPDAPHHVLQVLDATTGQNAVSQVESFKESAHVSGLVITKLDGTAKGGIVVAVAKKAKIPIHFIGLGEGIGDISHFNAKDFAQNLLTV